GPRRSARCAPSVNRWTAATASIPTRHGPLRVDLTGCSSGPSVAIVAVRRITLADGLLEALFHGEVAPGDALGRVAGDAVEDGADQLAGAEAHVLVGLVDQQLAHGELVRRDGGEPRGE